MLELSTAVLFCGVLINLVWHSVRLGMSPTPSSKKALRAIDKLLETYNQAEQVIDLGSGWGTLVIALARKHPDLKFIGYEYSLFPMLWARIICRLMNIKNCRIVRENFYTIPMDREATLLCYLSPVLMAKLRGKLLSENCGATLIISNTFGIRHWKPIHEIRLNDILNNRVYAYRTDPELVSKTTD